MVTASAKIAPAPQAIPLTNEIVELWETRRLGDGDVIAVLMRGPMGLGDGCFIFEVLNGSVLKSRANWRMYARAEWNANFIPVWQCCDIRRWR